MPALDLRGCLEDAPKFRKRVNAHEESVQHFESSLKTIIKLARTQVNLSTEYSLRQQELAREFQAFGQSQDDPIVAHALDKFGKSLLEVEKCRNLFNSHITNTFIEPLEAFSKTVLGPVKEIRKRFEKCSDDVDAALSRYMGKRARDPTIAEAAKELADARKAFHKVYMEYVTKLNEVEAKKKVDYMEDVLAYMYTKSVFHHQSYEILKDSEPFMRDLTGLLGDSRQRHSEESAEAQIYQDLYNQKDAELYSPMHDNRLDQAEKPSLCTTKSGYLFERKGGRMLQSWVRKYFALDGEELTFSTRSAKPSKDDDGPSSYNLRVCSVKTSDNYDRRFCFELISPTRVLTLQAENEQDMLDWVETLRHANQVALNSDNAPPKSLQADRTGGSDASSSNTETFSSLDTETNRLLLKTLKEAYENTLCADCGAKDSEWASTNLGVVVCIECSGIHRSLGVHVSKVRSLSLDKWETEAIEVMLRLGNQVANSIFEGAVPDHMETFRIHADSTRPERDLWITEKYVKRSFVQRNTDQDESALGQLFWDAISKGSLPDALRYLAQGANVDYKNKDEQSQTALQRAVQQDDEVAVEFLLQWSADVNEVDAHGWTSLHYAAAANNVRLVLVLLKRHAKADASDHSGKTALDLAVHHQNVQAVTALRLFAFDKQHNASPASSLDFGFREAMSSFKHNNLGSSSTSDLRHHSNPDLIIKDKPVLFNDDQHPTLLRPND